MAIRIATIQYSEESDELFIYSGKDSLVAIVSPRQPNVAADYVKSIIRTTNWAGIKNNSESTNP